MRLIDADALKKQIIEKKAKAGNIVWLGYASCERLVDIQPTIDIECIGCKEDCYDIALCNKNPHRKEEI